MFFLIPLEKIDKMGVFDQVRVVIYRCHEKGIEIFLENTGFDSNSWRIPFEEIAKYDPEALKNAIKLDPVETAEGLIINAVAIEGDWHDIPSIRKLVEGDVKIVKGKCKELLDHGAYFAMKEAFKKVLPQEYEMLHELKDILTSRNMLSNI